MTRGENLNSPRQGLALGIHYDPDAFGKFSETIARFLGTGRFLAGQTIFVAAWIVLNALAFGLRWDPYPFILLNLAFSTQAAYAAPLILLAQNRQADRDRLETDRDRDITARTQADAEYLAREIASIRLSLAGVARSADLERAASDLQKSVDRVIRQIDESSTS